MNNSHKHLLSAISFTLLSTQSFAAATLVHEMSALNVGTAGAGSAVLSETASAAYTNPAAMASMKEQAISVNLATMALDVSYQDSRDDQLSSENAGGVQPYGSLYYVSPLTSKSALGFTLAATGGSSLDYGEQYAGALGLNELSLAMTQFSPSIGYQLTDTLNIGAGLHIEYAQFEQSSLNSRASIETDSVAFGYSLGATYRMSNNHEIGITYRSKIEHDMKGNLNFIKQSDAGIGLINAAKLEVSGLHQVTDPLSVVWSVGQEFWSQNQATSIQFRDFETDKTRQFDDVWFASLGMRYNVTEKFRLETGLGYASSPQEDPSLQYADLPVDEQRRYSTGMSYQMTRSTLLKGYYSYVDYGNPAIDNGRMKGSFDNSNHFLGLEINHSF